MVIGYILGVAFSLARPPVIYTRGNTVDVPISQNHPVDVTRLLFIFIRKFSQIIESIL